MKQAHTTVTPDVLENIKDLAVNAATYFKHNCTAVRALKSAEQLPPSSIAGEELREAASYFQERMEYELSELIEELCTLVGVDYMAALEGERRPVTAKKATEVES